MKQTSGRLGEAVERITAPFGARSLTAAQITAQAEMQAAQQPAKVRAEKWRVLRDLTTARARLGLTAATLTVLEALLTFLPEAMLAPDREAGVELVVFPSNRTLSARARGLSEAALRRHLAALVETGLVIRRDSPNGKRYVRRGEGGQVTQAFGFDLTPLALRAGEFAAWPIPCGPRCWPSASLARRSACCAATAPSSWMPSTPSRRTSRRPGVRRRTYATSSAHSCPLTHADRSRQTLRSSATASKPSPWL